MVSSIQGILSEFCIFSFRVNLPFVATSHGGVLNGLKTAHASIDFSNSYTSMLEISFGFCFFS